MNLLVWFPLLAPPMRRLLALTCRTAGFFFAKISRSGGFIFGFFVLGIIYRIIFFGGLFIAGNDGHQRPSHHTISQHEFLESTRWFLRPTTAGTCESAANSNRGTATTCQRAVGEDSIGEEPDCLGCFNGGPLHFSIPKKMCICGGDWLYLEKYQTWSKVRIYIPKPSKQEQMAFFNSILALHETINCFVPISRKKLFFTFCTSMLTDLFPLACRLRIWSVSYPFLFPCSVFSDEKIFFGCIFFHLKIKKCFPNWTEMRLWLFLFWWHPCMWRIYFWLSFVGRVLSVFADLFFGGWSPCLCLLLCLFSW